MFIRSPSSRCAQIEPSPDPDPVFSDPYLLIVCLFVPFMVKPLFLTSEMLRSLSSPLSPSAPLFDSAAADLPRRRPWTVAVASCSGQRSNPSIPKRNHFDRHPVDYLIKEPPLLQKAANDISDYCLTLEGDECYSCWRAYFELRDLQKEFTVGEAEELVRWAGGVKTLIDLLHSFTGMLKRREQEQAQQGTSCSAEEKQAAPFPVEQQASKRPSSVEEKKEAPIHVPDCLPKTWEELEEEERAKWNDTPHMRLLRRMGRPPAWFTPRPDHETD